MRGRIVGIRELSRAVLVAAACGALATLGVTQDGPAPDRTEALVEGLRAGDVDARRDAADRVRLAGRDVQRKALPALIDRLRVETDGRVRLAVLDAVAALGPDAAPAVPALVQALRAAAGGRGRDESPQDYRSALALAAVGKPAVEALRGLLKEPKESVRAEALMALGRIGADAGPAVPDLIPLLGDPSERVRRDASLALGRIGPAAVGPLIAASTHRDAVVRARAVEGLGHLPAPDDRAHRAVLAAARDAAPEVRAASVRALARFKLPDAVMLPTLKASLRDEDEPVRLAAIDWLAERPATLPALALDLELLLTAKDDGVARHAAFLLGKIGPDAAPRLLQALRLEESRIDPIAEALARIGRPVVVLLTRAADSPEPRVRRGAALALGRVRPIAPGIVRTLTAGLDDPDPRVRAAFLTAIAQLGRRAREAVPALRTLLEDPSADIRLQALDVLAQSAPRDDRLVDDLATTLDDADPRVQRRAIALLRPLGPPGRKALPAVIGQLDDGELEVRLAAAELIGTHGQAAADAVPTLLACLDDPSPRLRTMAAQTLGKLGRAAQPAFARLAELVAAEPVEVSEAATSALGNLEVDVETLQPPLARALRDDRPEVRRAATRVIQRLGPDGALFVPELIELAGDKESRRTVERLLRPFEARGPDVRSVPALVRQLGHDRVPVRLLAVKFLGLAGGNARDALPALERLRDDPSVEVRKQAAAAVEQISAARPSKGPAPAESSPR